MTDHGWFFKRQPAGFRDRNPISNAFFASEAVGSVVSALVREGVQNSGDARSEKAPADQPVQLRIYVSGEANALPASDVAEWGGGLWKHVAAKDGGLRTPPTPEESCRFLVFEDFGTTGLCGDTASDRPCKDPFYCFFRAENASSKASDQDGSWGVGKTAFPRASRANAFFALSTRETDERTVLMGSLTLRTRHVDSEKYTPDSWFGRPQPKTSDGGIIQPIEDEAVIRRFHRQFGLSRPLAGPIESRAGTSIVVPWCDPEFTRETLAQAVIESCFLPIINGDIVVTIGTSPLRTDDLLLNAGSIEEAAVNLIDAERRPSLLASIRLAAWAREKAEAARVAALHEPVKASVKWDLYSLPEADRDRLRGRFEAGEPIAIRVPVPLRKKKDKSERTSHLDVFLQRTVDGSTVRPVFVRGSVVVPDHQIKKVPGAVAIIRSARDELGSLLRAAEDPGHKEWSTETENFAEFKESYLYAKSYLTFAREAALRTFRLLQDLEAEEDFDLLGDVFSLLKPPDDEGVKPGGGGKRRKRKKPVVVIERPPQMVEVTRIEGGFTVGRASAESPTPARIRVSAAYDVRKGNPFQRWDPADFSFDKKPLTIEHDDGLVLDKTDGNRLDLRVLRPDYSLTVRGFDTTRGDLIVNVRPEGRLDDSAD